MTITSCLPDELVRTLDRVAKERQSARSAVMREALELYLRRMQPSAWLAAVLQGKPTDRFHRLNPCEALNSIGAEIRSHRPRSCELAARYERRDRHLCPRRAAPSGYRATYLAQAQQLCRSRLPVA